jgi:GT2 family glycosyltransferase
VTAADDVVVAVSAFRSDEAVVRLLTALHASAAPPFGRVLVVDSLPSGDLEATIRDRGWKNVRYHAYDRNLGSAGNLAERLRRAAAETEASYVYALNHDAPYEESTLRALLAQAVTVPRLGAAYPLRRRRGRAGWDVTGRREFPLRAVTAPARPEGPAFDVWWGSSNGTLYALGPVRAGLLPPADFWMGWEDLAYGWMLADAGYRQVCVTAAVFDDPMEYATRSIGGRAVTLTDKPPWYAYYFARNLLLASRDTHRPLRVRAEVAARISAEVLVSATLRSRRRERLRLLAAGVRDGLTGRHGKYRVP